MKIYFAYRTGYEPNLRYLKSFEANSILEWFSDNWNILCSEAYSEFLGTDVYGFPIKIEEDSINTKKQSFFGKLFKKKEKEKELKPKNFQELLQYIEAGVYTNEIESNENYIKVLTDDDEIDLAWFVFTEEYKLQNEDKVDIWFNNILPTTYGAKGLTLDNEIISLQEKGQEEGCTYFISCPIYDSANFDCISVTKIEGVRLNHLLDFLLQNSIEENDDVLYAVDELNYIKYLAEQLKTNDLQKVLEIFAQIPLTELQGIDYTNFTLKEIKEMEMGNIPGKSKVNISEHCAEISVNSLELFYNYYIIIDDLWIEKNETLAKSLIHFGSNI